MVHIRELNILLADSLYGRNSEDGGITKLTAGSIGRFVSLQKATEVDNRLLVINSKRRAADEVKVIYRSSLMPYTNVMGMDIMLHFNSNKLQDVQIWFIKLAYLVRGVPH